MVVEEKHGNARGGNPQWWAGIGELGVLGQRCSSSTIIAVPHRRGQIRAGHVPMVQSHYRRSARRTAAGVAWPVYEAGPAPWLLGRGRSAAGLLDAVRAAESLGYESVWTSEASGSDALTRLPGSARTRRRCGWGPASCTWPPGPRRRRRWRPSPSTTSPGSIRPRTRRVRSQLVEGWYWQPFDPPLGRTREYVEIVPPGACPARAGGVPGPVPLAPAPAAPGWAGLSPPWCGRSVATSPSGWPPRGRATSPWPGGRRRLDRHLLLPHHDAHYRAALAVGAGRSGARARAEDFESSVRSRSSSTTTSRLRPAGFASSSPRFIGGMGPSGRNFHYDAFVRMGYGKVATRVRDLWLARRTHDAAAAIPTAMIEAVALIGHRQDPRGAERVEALSAHHPGGPRSPGGDRAPPGCGDRSGQLIAQSPSPSIFAVRTLDPPPLHRQPSPRPDVRLWHPLPGCPMLARGRGHQVGSR